MTPSLHTLLHEVLDYAGLFPPATLPLDEAVRNYAAYKRGDHAWMMSRFICPATRLVELDDYAALLFGDHEPLWRSSVTVRGAEDLESFLVNLQQDLVAVSRFIQRHGEAASVDMLEAPIPPAVVREGEDAVLELLERSAEALASTSSRISPYYEVRVVGQDPEQVAAALSAFQQFNKRWSGPRLRSVAAKIRTGGATSEANPSVHQVAFFMGACRRLDLPFKATAGLHHPLYHRDASTGAPAHGFLNFFIASALSHAHLLELQNLIEVLQNRDIQRFEFGDDQFRWGDLSVSLKQLRAARSNLAVSFGSCSFEEPLEHLAALGLM